MATDFKYVGAELDLFAAVSNWKAYWSETVRPFISGDVLEVGAGIGSNTRYLDSDANGRWVCLEPDPQLISRLKSSLRESASGRKHEVICGTLQNLPTTEKFDTIIYIDVLEHIENDREELENAAACLRAGGRIVVLSPAHNQLFTPFDAAIGHFRRYNRSMLRSITPPGVRIEKLMYLDCAGLLLSAANRFVLHQSMPTKEQLRFWDRRLIAVSRILDKCLMNSVGKTIVAVWRNAG